MKMEKAITYQYDIVLNAPIGEKKGVIKAHVFDEKIEGEIMIMRHSNYFSGTISKDGCCEIYGSIKTLLGSISYSGCGTFSHDEINLRLNTENTVMTVCGKRSLKEE